ncbi:uncharacterized protein LOC124434573 [Xenia sp. Carnegie-2017]|uniref:uncharacterized protein LOC124434573 n=1 Tax=Xenia sp. Carnegie-2017 TaxID=2897299 RepID=UPI001F03B81B|nr:uncharacterized protein LOC124434573 [Xenia sp. Carnegie-2017]XP_046840415.1 uncharacterized protein LOC124434573 [Xenia sp. Carnegie-2017]
MAFRSQFCHPKLKHLLLPSALFVCGLIIFICGLVRTFHVGEKMPRNAEERKTVQARNEYVEWWNGSPLMLSALLGIVAVLYEKPLVLKIAVFSIAVCFVLSIFSLMLDAGELAWLSLNVHHMKFLKMEGFVCKDSFLRHKVYNFTVCECKLGEETGSTFSFYLSWTTCKLLLAQYYVYFIIVFYTSCSCGLCLFTLAYFVLKLKSMSQIKNAGNVDEKPLNEDFDNLHGSYVTS